MRIVFLVARPTQFEVPFYRFAAAAGGPTLEVWYSEPGAAAPVHDPELGRAVDWGFDLLGGYPSAIVPEEGRLAWLRERLAPGAVDLLVVNGYTRPEYRRAARLARRAGIPTALRLDSVSVPEPWHRRFARRLFVREVLGRLFDRFLVTGSLARRYVLAQGIAPGRIGRFPYAVDHERFAAGAAAARPRRAELRARLGVPSHARMLLALAKLHPRESPGDLLAARERLEREDLWWVLAGEGPQRAALTAWIAERGLDRVRLPGYVPYPELPAWYAAADLFVHPAHEERWGVSVAEALAGGLPVVASTGVGAAHDLVVPGENGAVAAAGDAAALAGAIEAALALPPERVAAASARILPEWGYEATWRELQEMAESVRGIRR